MDRHVAITRRTKIPRRGLAIPFSTATTIPSFTTTDALKSLHINSSGTALEFRNVDLSAYIPLTSVGAASGVAALDATGRLAASQIPTVMALDSMHFVQTGTTNSTTAFVIKRIYGEIVRIDKISVRTSSGTCDITLQVDGVNVPGFTAVGASSTPVGKTLRTASRWMLKQQTLQKPLALKQAMLRVPLT